ncbi:MAG: peptide ABC transporter substrate-binding protein [Actinomycetota bacterium]
MRRPLVVKPIRVRITTVLVLALITGLTACGGSGSGSSENTLVIGAEQWPDCVNPITQCANSSWQLWAVGEHVFPQLTELNDRNEFVASPLLAEMPTVANGGISGEGANFTITYRLNPKAVWDDGTPITSEDVRFSWRAVLDTKGTLTTAGYDKITAIDTPDPQTAIVRFGETYPDWPDVLGGYTGVILQKAKFPGGTDVSKTMQTAIDFSGGPWKLQSFSDARAVLVRNERYWDPARRPKLDSVTFVPATTTGTEIEALKTGQVDAIYPQPAPELPAQLRGDDIETAYGVTTQYESLVMNLKEGRPFADPNVREAFSYAFDRNLFLSDIVKPFAPDTALLQCAAWVPGIGPWCPGADGPWSDVEADPAKVETAMARSGYAKDSEGFWAKDGRRLEIGWSVTSGNARREATQAQFIPLLAEQGFSVRADNSDADTFFAKQLPAGEYDLSMFINVVSPDPAVSALYACDQIPGPENDGAGQNVQWYCDPEAERLMKIIDTSIDPAARLDAVRDLDQLLRDQYVAFPLNPFPALVAWRTDRVAGPVDRFVNSPLSVFRNLWEWERA